MTGFDHLYFDVSAPPNMTAKAVREHGCIVLRHAIDPAPLASCHDAVIHLFENDDTDFGKENIVRHRGWCNGAWFAERHFGDDMAFAKLIARPQLSGHLAAMLDQPALHPLMHIRYRHPEEQSTALPFHQHPNSDAGGELSLKRIRMFNVLIPFTDFDGSCADMEYVARPLAKLLPITGKPETQFASFELDREPILEAFADSLWRPHLATGDICVFRDGTLHRTYVDRTMTRRRTSIDLRIFDAKNPLSVYAQSPRIPLPCN